MQEKMRPMSQKMSLVDGERIEVKESRQKKANALAG